MAWVVVVTEKGGKPRAEVFDQSEITVGRVQDNDIVLPKGNISKRHARIVLRDGKFIIVDLKTTNGTFVNGKRISSPQVLKELDKIYVGDFTLVLQPDPGPGVQAPPRAPRTTSGGGDGTQPDGPVVAPPPRPSGSVHDEITPPVARVSPGDGTGPTLSILRDGVLHGEHRMGRAIIGIGRHPENDIVLDDRTLARFHCRIERRGDDLFVIDLGAQNGVNVNGARISGEKHVVVGDVVHLGRYAVRVDGLVTHQVPASSVEDTRKVMALLRDDLVTEIVVAPGEEVHIIRGAESRTLPALGRAAIQSLLSTMGAQVHAARPVFDGPAPNQRGWHVTARDLDGDGPHARLKRVSRFNLDDDIDPIPPA